MAFININRELCSETEHPKWFIQKENTLPEKEGFRIVFDMSEDSFRHQAADLKSWNEYLVSIGMLKLTESQKLDSKGKITEKTEDELFQESLITLEELKRSRSEKVNRICADKITSGFRSSALGEEHIYDSEDYDQWNLIGAAAVQSPTYYKCRKTTGEEVFLVHTNSQMVQVLRDGAQLKLFYMMNAKNLKDRIQAASTYAELNAVDVNSGWAKI